MISLSTSQRYRPWRVVGGVTAALLVTLCLSCCLLPTSAASLSSSSFLAQQQHHVRVRSLQDTLPPPLVIGQSSTVVVENIQVELRNIDAPLSNVDDIAAFQTIVAQWVDDFFLRGGGAGQVSEWSSTVVLTEQSVTAEDTTLLVTYNQICILTPIAANVVVADLILLPYLNIFFNAGLGESLRTQIPSLAELPRRTIAVPQIMEDGPETTVPTTLTEPPVVVETTSVPTLSPAVAVPLATAAPSLPTVTMAPTTARLIPTTVAPVTMAPIMVTTGTTAAPTIAPAAPTGRSVSVLVENVVIEFPPGSTPLATTAIGPWEQVTQEWWETYFHANGNDSRTTASSLRDVQATFALQSQQTFPSAAGGDTEEEEEQLLLLIVTDVSLQYLDTEPFEDPTQVVLEPFQQGDTTAYVNALQAQGMLLQVDPETALVSAAVGEASVPVVPAPEPPQTNPDDGPSSGVIVTILLVLLLVLAAVGLYTYFNVQSKERRRVPAPPSATAGYNPYKHAEQDKLYDDKDTTTTADKAALPNFQNNSSTKSIPYDAATLGGGSDPFKDAQSDDLNSLATSNFDYDKVGAASRNKKSLASSLPGDGSSMVSSKSYTTTSDAPPEDEEDQFVIYAPAGRLGLVVDNPDEGAPVIHSIKPDSVLSDQIQVGDRLIGVDEVDVSGMSPVKVSKLISKRSTNPLRKLTLTRLNAAAADDGLLSYGKSTLGDGDADSNFDTMSRLSGMESNVDTMSRLSGMESNVDTMSRMSGGGIDTDAEDDGSQMFSKSDDETSFVASMSRVSVDGDDDSAQTPAEGK